MRAKEEIKEVKRSGSLLQKIARMRRQRSTWYFVCRAHAKQLVRKDVDGLDGVDPDQPEKCYLCDEPAAHEYSPNLLAILQEQMGYIQDRTRYIVCDSMFGYLADSNTFCMNLEQSTIFREKKIAQAVARALGKRFRIVECKVDKQNKIVKNSLPKRS